MDCSDRRAADLSAKLAKQTETAAAQERVRKEELDWEWRHLPELPLKRLIDFLRSSAGLDSSDPRRPVWQGQRLPRISRADFIRVVEASNLRARPRFVKLNWMDRPVFRGKVWIVGVERWKDFIRSDEVTSGGWVGVHESGLSLFEHTHSNKLPNPGASMGSERVTWEPTPWNLDIARTLLQEPDLGRFPLFADLLYDKS